MLNREQATPMTMTDPVAAEVYMLRLVLIEFLETFFSGPVMVAHREMTYEEKSG